MCKVTGSESTEAKCQLCYLKNRVVLQNYIAGVVVRICHCVCDECVESIVW